MWQVVTFIPRLSAIRSVTLLGQWLLQLCILFRKKRAVGSVTFKTIDTVISVNNHGPCYLCHVTLSKDYYRVDMSMCRCMMSCFMK